MKEDPLDEREEYYNTDDGGQEWSSGKYFFDASDGSNLTENGYGPPEATESVGPTETTKNPLGFPSDMPEGMAANGAAEASYLSSFLALSSGTPESSPINTLIRE